MQKTPFSKVEVFPVRTSVLTLKAPSRSQFFTGYILKIWRLRLKHPTFYLVLLSSFKYLLWPKRLHFGSFCGKRKLLCLFILEPGGVCKNANLLEFVKSRKLKYIVSDSLLYVICAWIQPWWHWHARFDPSLFTASIEGPLYWTT